MPKTSSRWPSSVVDSWVLASRESASLAGFPVLIRELPEFIAAARARLENSLDSAVERGKLDADKRDAALARVTFTSELKDVAGAIWSSRRYRKTVSSRSRS